MELISAPLTLNPIATPSNPASGKIKVYLDTSDGKFKIIKSDGSVSILEPVNSDQEILASQIFS